MGEFMNQKQSQTKKCAAYVRVSTAEQDGNGFTSIQAQEKSCKSFIDFRKNLGWEYYDTFKDIASAKNTNRPALQSLIQTAKKGMINVVVIYKIDRICRSMRDFYALVGEFEKLGVELAITSQNFDTSNGAGRLMRNLLASVAEFERDMISDRVRDKRSATMREGFWQGGWVPLGFDRKYSKKYNRHILMPNDKESEAVMLLFDKFIETHSQSKAKDIINAMGFRTKTRKQTTKEGKERIVGGKRFDEDAITRILKNRIYIGELYDERTKTAYEQNIKHKAIITDKKKWLYAQEILAGKSKKYEGQKKFRPDRDKYTMLLKGLVHCSDCGSTMTTDFAGKSSANGDPFLYYTCTQVNELGRSSKCMIRSMPARSLENLIIDATLELAKHPSLIEDVVKQSSITSCKKLSSIEKELSQLGVRNSEINGKLANSYELAMAEGVGALSRMAKEEATEFEKEKQTIDLQISNLERQRDDLTAKTLSEDAVRKIFCQFSDVVNKLTLVEKKLYCQLLISRIDVYPWDPSKNEKGLSAKLQKGLLQSDLAFQTRTRWYRLKIRYRELPDFPSTSESEKTSSGLHPLGSEGRIRTGDPLITRDPIVSNRRGLYHHPVLLSQNLGGGR